MSRFLIAAAIAAVGLMAGAPVHAAPLAKGEGPHDRSLVTDVKRTPGPPRSVTSRPNRGAKAPRIPAKRFSAPRIGGPRFYPGPRFRGFYYGAPYVGFGAYGAYYAYPSLSGDCDWLRERAEFTGTPYWWRRYQNCVDF
jgi:hypothetical protein